MLDTYTYPSRSQLAAEAAATDRDCADLARLHQLHEILAGALRQIEEIEEIRHPEARWGVADLVEMIRHELVNCDGERERIVSGPFVVGEG